MKHVRSLVVEVTRTTSMQPGVPISVKTRCRESGEKLTP
jgi:hypothetical protein